MLVLMMAVVVGQPHLSKERRLLSCEKGAIQVQQSKAGYAMPTEV